MVGNSLNGEIGEYIVFHSNPRDDKNDRVTNIVIELSSGYVVSTTTTSEDRLAFLLNKQVKS
jgi:hypothetical protein